MVSITVDTSAIVNGQANSAASVLTPIANLKSAVEDTLNGVQAFDRISFGSAEALTIAAGVITVTKTHVKVDTEAAAATDDLDTINGGAEGRWITLRITNSARVVVLKHGTGNIVTANGADYTINSTNIVVWLNHNGTNWMAQILPTTNLLTLGASSDVTVTGGAITRTRSSHTVVGSGAAAVDLTTINGGVAGDLLTLRLGNSNHSVRIVPKQAGAGNIWFHDNKPRVLRGNASGAPTAMYMQQITLVYNGSFWSELNGGGEYLSRPDYRNMWGEKAAAATYASIGMAAGTNGGAGAVTEANSDVDTFVSQAIGAVGGTIGGRKSSTFDLVRRAHLPRFTAVIRTGSDITNMRFWIGIFSAAPTNADTLGATEGIGFRYSTVAGDGGWVGVCSDGAAQTVSATVAAIAASTVYRLTIEVVDIDATTYAVFRVNDDIMLSVSTNLPASSTELGAAVLGITTTATAKTMDISRYFCEYGDYT